MMFVAQYRSRRFFGSWTDWAQCGDPMTDKEAREFLEEDELTGKIRTVEFRVVAVPDDWPRVFVPRGT